MIKKSYYNIEINKRVRNFIKKLDNNLKNRVLKEIKNLELNPIPRSKKHILDIKENKMLCEFSVDKLRFYYIFFRNSIIINEIEYLGKVSINYAKSNHKSGNSKNYPNQQKFITWLKKLFKK